MPVLKLNDFTEFYVTKYSPKSVVNEFRDHDEEVKVEFANDASRCKVSGHYFPFTGHTF